MEIVQSTEEMIARSRAWKAEGRRIGLVPTMGYLHRGHRSLMALLRPQCDVLVVSLYVNPLQFGPKEDFSRYPRDPEGDARACEEEGVDLLFMPDQFYPPGFSTRVAVAGVSSRWEGALRPGHFEGVATVVARFFGVTGADVAVFGEKDYQQLAVLRAMVRDLAMKVEIVPGPLVRDDDGLALSSRNVYLTTEQRKRALTLHQALFAMRAATGLSVAERLVLGRQIIDCDQLDYLAVVDADSLEPVDELRGPARVLVVGRYGATRLLDNVELQ